MRSATVALRVSLLFILATMLTSNGCNLFRKTTKVTTSGSRSSEKLMDHSMLEWKNADKQSRIFTWWDSGSVYQFQEIREQADQAKATALAIRQKDTAKQELTTKQSAPPVQWILVGLGVLVVGAVLLYRKLRRLSSFK